MKIETIKKTIVANLNKKHTKTELLKALEDSYCFVFVNLKDDKKIIEKTIGGIL